MRKINDRSGAATRKAPAASLAPLPLCCAALPVRPATARRPALRALLGTTALVAFGLVLAPSPSRATNWTGANSTGWFDPANWSGGVPTSATNAVINTATPNPAEVDGAAAQARDVFVGHSGTGTLTIQNGGAVSSSLGVVGYNAGSTGTVTMGAGSSWTNTGNLYAGHSGTGTLTIQNGGAASNNIGYIGVAAGAIGTVTVDGTGSSWTNGGVLFAGYSGTATLTIQNGGAVSSSVGYLGYNAGSTGTVTVDGAGSSWTNSFDTLYVGSSGTGTLTIQNGGAVSSAIGAIGYIAGSTGTVTVDGTGSSWSIGLELYAGHGGTGALMVQNGGTVSSGSTGYIGLEAGSTGNVTVDGVGSSWTNSGDLNVGRFGTGTLTIQNGGAVSSGSTGYIGFEAGSTGNVTVDGAGSSWTNTSDLNVGVVGTGTLTIQNGGTVSNAEAFIGYFAGSTGTATVDGTGSSWTNTGNLSVGLNGTGALTIQNGGAVSNLMGYIGVQAGSNGAVTVDGTNSSWTNAGDLTVGYLGTGTLTIQNGGAVSSRFAWIDGPVGSTGTVTVDGTNSSWTNSHVLTVGHLGTGTLNIQNGGRVSNTDGFIGYFFGSTGTVTVDGTGSLWTNTTNLSVGLSGTGALTIQNGGAVSSADGFIGHFAGTGTVTVDGAGSTWTNTGGLYVGNQSPGTLTIQNGGAVSNGIGFIGYSAGVTATVMVDGAGSTWTNSGDLYVGNQGTGTLTIQNGGTVSAPTVFIASQNTSTGTLNIGAASGQAALAPGTLNAPSVEFGTGAGLIVFNHTAANYAFNPVISGAGSVQVEAGTTDLAAHNTYTGATTVNGGTLNVNGSIASSVLTTVNAGGTLGGTGTIGATTIASGGALSPGNSIGTLTVQGDLTFNAGGIYAVEVSPTNADRTNVTGTATLTGATVDAVALPGSFRAQTYTILNATGGFGGTQFAGITGSSFSPGARNPHLTYDANNVFLVLDPGTIQLPAGLGGNQSGVAGAINRYVESGGAPPVGFDALLNMSGTQLTNALGQVSGQPGASTSQAGMTATGQFVNAIGDSAFGESGQGGALGYAQAPKVSREANDAYAAVTPRDRVATFDQRWNVWASAYGGNSRVSGDSAAGTSTTNSRSFGTAVGASYRSTPDTQLGFALGGAGSSFGLDGGFGGGKSNIFNAAIYAKHNFGAAYVSGLLGYSWQDTTTDRNVLGEQLHASFKAQALSARLEGGWRYATPSFGITPYAALQTTTFFLPAYGETATSGPGIFALNYASKTTTATRGELGAKFDKAMLVRDGVFTLKAKTAWAHDWNTERAATATFQQLPGATFTTNGAQPSANAALLSLGAEMKWHKGWSLAGNLDGEFSRTTASYTGKGTVTFAW